MASLRVLCVCVAALFAFGAPMAMRGVEAQLGWGKLGHYMTAAIAQEYLSPAAKAGCQHLLPEVNGDIGLIASWADSVARDLYPWSPQLHYINTPDWACNYERSRDCHGENGAPMACVDGAIQNYTMRLMNASLSENQLKEALMFLVHFVGDIHQPLHVGFTTDEGGNTEYGTFMTRTHRRLHQLWDEDIIEKRIYDNFSDTNSTYLSYYMKQLSTGIYAQYVNAWRVCSGPESPPADACSQAWASESIILACSTAYVDQDGNKIMNGFNLQYPYYEFALPVIEQRIAMGGIRLANVLNKLFAQSEGLRRFVDKKTKLLAQQQEEEQPSNESIAWA